MRGNIDINKLDTWKLQIGLLPVPLFYNKPNVQQYVLLNGNLGNFCLDLDGNTEDTNLRNYAWSSDVGHYINVIRDNVEVYRWDKKVSSIERYSRKSVESNLDKFYEYLQANQPRRDISVISFAINIFRKLRGVINGNLDGRKALKAFLYLLACVSDNTSKEKLTISKWGIDDADKDIVSSIRGGDWDTLMEELKRGFLYYDLMPDVSLILRHASGQLFQEAHYIASIENPSQTSFEGFIVKKVSIIKKTQSIGVHYTPPALARTVVEEALSAIGRLPGNLTIFDPACGSGEFLKEILRQLSLRKYHGKLKLLGWDNSQSAVDISRFVLAYEKLSFNGSKNISIEINLQDALVKDVIWPKNVDIVLMNPPFQSWEDMTDEYKNIVKENLGDLLEKRPDLSSAFILKASQSLRNEGVLATILPASILDAYSYVKFREYFASIMKPHLIGKLGSQSIFSNATIDAAIYIGKCSNKVLSPISLWSDHRLESISAALRALRRSRYLNIDIRNEVIDGHGYSIYHNSSIGEPSKIWAVRSYRAYTIFSLLKDFTKVGDSFNIRQGVRTGCNPAFIINETDFRNLPLKEQSFFRPAVTNESIREGYLQKLAYVFYPYGKDIPQIDTEEDLKKHLKIYYRDFLGKNRDELINRARKSEKNWWKLSEHRAWQVEVKPKLISTSFGKTGSFAWDNSGDFIVVQGHYWEPKANYVNKFNKEIGLAYLAVLNSSLINILLSSVSKHLGGGQWDLSRKYIKNMPIPDLFSKNIDIMVLKKLTNTGNLISQKKEYDKVALNDIILDLYKLPKDYIGFYEEI